MKTRYNIILRVHGVFLLLLGLMMASQTLLGNLNGAGPLKFLFNDPLKSVGLFEAYLLAGFSGSIFVILSGKHYKTEWHLLPATVHLILLITNIIFWKAYALASIVAIGYVSTTAHVLFILLELVCYFKLKKLSVN